MKTYLRKEARRHGSSLHMADESKRESVNRITLKPKITPQLKVVGQG